MRPRSSSRATRGRPLYNLDGLARWCRILLFVQAGITLIVFATGLVSGPPSQAAAGYALTVVIQTLVYITAGIFVLRWIYLANANAHAMGAQNFMGPAMAVGCYFIPIANFIMPFQSMRDIWRASTEPRDWEAVRAPALIGLWWMCWVISLIAAAVSAGLDQEGAGPALTQWVMIVTALSDLVLIPASLLLARIIGRITAKQNVAATRETFG